MGDDRESGAAATEYGLLLAAVAALIILVAAAMGILSSGAMKHTGDSIAGQSGRQSMPLRPVLAAPTSAKTATAGHRCDRHGAYASTATGVRVQCVSGPRGTYRWRVA